MQDSFDGSYVLNVFVFLKKMLLGINLLSHFGVFVFF